MFFNYFNVLIIFKITAIILPNISKTRVYLCSENLDVNPKDK